MLTCANLRLDPNLEPSDLWRAVAHAALQWIDASGRARHDVVMLLPFAELLPHARQALAALGGWQPRVETLRTLNASLEPQLETAAGAPCGDRSIDRLLAERWLRQLPALDQWRQHDPLAFAQRVADLVEAAQALVQAASDLAPAERAPWWQAVDAAMRVTDGPGALEAAMARLAAQWARQAGAPATDRLHALRPAAWVVVQAGGANPGVKALIQCALERDVACLLMQTDAGDDWEAGTALCAQPTLLAVDTAEQEAWAAATTLIDCVARGQTPVALIAQDRLLVRRVRALLERRALPVFDESGWALSTTRAAARLMALLRAASPAAGPDAWLDGLKVLALDHQRDGLDALEQHWRRHGTSIPVATHARPRLIEALAWWQQAHLQWQEFSTPASQTLSVWLQALAPLARVALGTEPWLSDPAALAVRAALRLDSGRVRADIDDLPLTLPEFVVWVDHALEQASFVDAAHADSALVVITPLARAILRPFGAIVFPATDERHLGDRPRLPNLLSESLLRQLGVEDRAQRQQRQALVFAQLLRHPRVTLLRRRSQGSEAIGASNWISCLQQSRRDQRLPGWPEHNAPLTHKTVQAQAVLPPAPVVNGALPGHVSASSVEALRACPYRFFARAILGLGEVDELEAEPDKRDYGDLLHLALQRFHDQRSAEPNAVDEVDRLQQLVREVARDSGLDQPAMFPYEAGMAAFAKRYVEWLAEHEAQAWRHQSSELALSCEPAALGGLRLQGRIDRVDRHAVNAGVQLIDYKTGRAQTLTAKVRDPLEDTQLAFYAAQWLQTAPDTTALSALYLALDDRDGLIEVAHKDVAMSAAALLEGLARDWQQLQRGAPLLALGEGTVCVTCEARGLCRRDHWLPLPRSPVAS